MHPHTAAVDGQSLINYPRPKAHAYGHWCDPPLDDPGGRDDRHLGKGVGGGEVLELLDEGEDVLAHLRM